MSLSSAETSSCSRWGAWASRLRCLWTVHRWVGTSPHRAARACSNPVPPSTIRNRGLTSPRLTRLSRTARHASLVSPPMFLTANSTFWPSSRTPSTTRKHDCGGLPVEPDPHHGAVENQADNRLLGQRAGVPGIPIALYLAPHPAHRILADGTAKDGGERPARPTRVGSGKIGAGDQCIGLPGSPLVGPQRRAPPLRRLAFGGVEPGARHRDLHPTKGSQQ